MLNRESKRKTASVVCIHEGVRYFGSDAVSFVISAVFPVYGHRLMEQIQGVRHPQDTYATLKNVIGKSFEDPLSAEYRDTFTNTMVKDFARGVVAFQQDSPSMTWSLEALVGMELAHAKAQAETYGGEPVTGAVITVPPYFGVFERRVILDAAELAGIKVLSLMNDETAGALFSPFLSVAQ